MCADWGPTGLLALLAWWLALQTLTGLYLAVTLPYIIIAALMVSSQLSVMTEWLSHKTQTLPDCSAQCLPSTP